MKSIKQYILEAEEDEEKDQNQEEKDIDQNQDDNKEDEKDRRTDIMFSIWKEPKKKVKWLEDGDYIYQKIEYQYISDDKKVHIDFLLGFDEKSKSWKLWVGKIGSTSYDDDPYYDFKTKKFSEAIIAALDKIDEFIEEVETDDPQNWVQFYKNL